MFWLLEIKYQICVSHIKGKDMAKKVIVVWLVII